MRDLYSEPAEKLYWLCLCKDCGWESDSVEHRDDLFVTECADCKGENITDEKWWG